MGIDALAKRHFTLIVCLLLGVAAYFQASGLGQLVGALIAPASAVPRGRFAGSRRLPPESDRDLRADAILDRNPFDSVTGPLHPRERTGPAPGEVSSSADPYLDPPCQVARVVLIASSDDPDWSFAAITGPDGRAVLRRRGEDFFGGRVVFVGSQHAGSRGEDDERGDWDRVWLTAPNGVRCQLRLGARPPKMKGPPPPPVAIAGPQSEIMSKIRRVSDHEFEVDRSAVDALINNPGDLLKTRVTPVKQGDRVVGLQLGGIRQGSLLGGLGLQNGDQLSSINGFEMNDPQKMLEAYTKLVHADHVTASVVRNGQPVNLDFSIK